VYFILVITVIFFVWNRSLQIRKPLFLLVPKIILLGHMVLRAIIILSHICHKGLKLSIFKFTGMETEPKNLQGIKIKKH
jgi:putative effector of murein hydrolase